MSWHRLKKFSQSSGHRDCHHWSGTGITANSTMFIDDWYKWKRSFKHTYSLPVVACVDCDRLPQIGHSPETWNTNSAQRQQCTLILICQCKLINNTQQYIINVHIWQRKIRSSGRYVMDWCKPAATHWHLLRPSAYGSYHKSLMLNKSNITLPHIKRHDNIIIG